MQQNYLNPAQFQNCQPQQSANGVSINIYSPQAYTGAPNCAQNPVSAYPAGFYSMYGQNQMPNLPLYPQNYNNMIQQNANVQNGLNALGDTNLKTKTDVEDAQDKKTDDKKSEKEEKKKTVIPLTDDYVKSLENYMNNDNSKIRLIGAKELMERFKEDENRKDNPSLVPLLNKALRDTSPSVRFLALTALQLGYSVGNDETVSILKEIQSGNKDKYGEDALLASEILLKLSAPEAVEKEQAVNP